MTGRHATTATVIAATFLAACSDESHDRRMLAAGPRPDIAALMKVADAQEGARKFSQCAACHTIAKGALDRNGPNLRGVYGQKMAANNPRFAYTAALRDAGQRWDAATLDAWIGNPMAVVPGTSMQFAGVSDPLDRADIIAYLREQSPARAFSKQVESPADSGNAVNQKLRAVEPTQSDRKLL